VNEYPEGYQCIQNRMYISHRVQIIKIKQDDNGHEYIIHGN
jgi:hypothetical protein